MRFALLDLILYSKRNASYGFDHRVDVKVLAATFQPHPRQLLPVPDRLLAELSTDNNAWLYVATPEPLRPRLEPLLAR
ncbi:hypothetical protein [Erwinia amylovora]|uniref:Uncharacterized protein n=3 Tax=Erwinia amylovora TaxID=552 RepID=A0A831ETN9_ERWAM|nr:hypothetical protein [Erwinia amylovora]CCO79834.1 hypothetical protein BN432_3055 [Erwinia amylovora Ea356]CDK16324.1 hypothetical protein LA635_2700 [Erwinia amylovora LA635]CDK19690.1 hypothetical protein LA636_2698 [Erwinia amylovora LA636]CDK23062.1 hypothetical protein LA637_2702 [Erwinia amylovora LA637]ATZ10552.1 hypothetical protein AD997_03275 [Erwinia amylovora]